MGYAAKKTEHAGAKHGTGAYWGRKKDAKKESNKTRRRNSNREIRQAGVDLDDGPFETHREMIEFLHGEVKKAKARRRRKR